jgi:HlyD family secretion protein
MVSDGWNIVRRWWRRGVQIALLVLVLGGLVYWLKLAPMQVVEHRIERGSIVAEVMGTGTLEAHVKTTVSSKISGRITDVLVDQGDRVTAGQLLVRLDGEELTQQVAIAQADREVTQEALVRLNTDKDAAMAVFDQAKKSHRRAQTAWAKQAVSQEDMDKATEALAIAQAGLSRAGAAIAEGQMKRLAAEKSKQYRRAGLADTEVHAPFDGLIVRRQRDPGDVVVPGSSILTLISTEELWISAWVDETKMAEVNEGQPARVVFRSEPDRSYPGKVARLGREADRETREFLVDVRVLQLPTNWAVGHRAEVYIQTAHKDDATLLPAKYVVWREGRSGLFISRDGHAEWRVIHIGLRSKDMIEVTDGLEPGETAVTPGAPGNTLHDGHRITP